MTYIRVSDEAIAKRRESISRLKEEIREREELSGQKDSVLWKKLGPAIKNSIQANQDKLDAILDEPSVNAAEESANARQLRGAIKAYKHILEAVEVEGVIETKRQRLHEMTEDLKRIETEQG